MARNAIMYSSRARSTGALCQTIDTRHADAAKLDLFRKRTKDEATLRYAAICVDHKSVAFFQENYPAGRAIAWPQEWCKKCQTMFESGKRIETKRATSKPAAAPLATTPVKTNGKRTSNKKANARAKRVHSAQTKPSPVVTKVAAEESFGPLTEAQSVALDKRLAGDTSVETLEALVN